MTKQTRSLQPGSNRLPWIVLATGLVWCATSITCSALLVPSDGAGGYFLIDHGRTEHYDTRLAAVAQFIVIAGLLCAVGAGIVVTHTMLAARTTRTGGQGAAKAAPTWVALAAGFALLLGGLIPLSVTFMAANPDSAWTPSLVLAPVMMFVVAICGFHARAIWQGRRHRPRDDGLR